MVPEARYEIIERIGQLITDLNKEIDDAREEGMDLYLTVENGKIEGMVEMIHLKRKENAECLHEAENATSGIVKVHDEAEETRLI